MRDVRVGPDGNVYLLTDETIGALLKWSRGSGAWKSLEAQACEQQR